MYARQEPLNATAVPFFPFAKTKQRENDFLNSIYYTISEITVIFKNKPPAIGNFSDCGYFLFLRRAEKAFHTAEKYFIFRKYHG